MKRYVFRLENVRKVRRLQEEIAKGDLLAANQAVATGQAELAAALEEYDRAVNAPSFGPGLDAFRKRRYFDELAGKAVIAARQKLAQLEEIADQQRLVWSEAASKVKVLDRLDERNREEHAIEVARQEALEVDDVVTGRYARAGAEGGEQ